MRKMSSWAKHNARTAQIIIVIAQVSLFILSATLGILLLGAHILLHQKFAELALLFILCAVVFYPYKSNAAKKYALRKSLEFTLGLGIFMCGCFITNRDKITSWNSFTPIDGHYVSLYSKESNSMPEKKTMTKKEMRKDLRAWFKQEKKNGNNLSWLWITLIVIGGLALELVVAALACGLGCEGSVTGAWAVAILGTALVVFLMVFTIKKITANRKKKKKAEEGNTTGYRRKRGALLFNWI